MRAAHLHPSPSRRHFLVRSAGLAIGVAFGGIPLGASAQASGGLTPTPWVTIGVDGTVTILSPASEMGQGVSTAMPMCLAEDLDVEWGRVFVKQAPHDPKAFGNRLFGGAQVTGASRTTRGYYRLLRVAGAQARQILLLAAAERWGVTSASLETDPGVVLHRASGRSISYGELAAFVRVPERLPEITDAMLKPLSQCRYLGRDIARLDLLPKVTGQAIYGIDIRLPGMVYGAVLRPPVQREKPLAIDDSAAKSITGYIKTVPLNYGVGVLATSTWAARKARDALQVTWSSGAAAVSYSSEDAKAAYQGIVNDLGKAGVEVEKHGDVVAAIAGAAKVIKADFQSGHLAHLTLEPMNATAQVIGGRVEVWTPTQAPSIAAAALAAVLQIPPENITINVTLLGGGFGRRLEPDFTVEAVLLARAADGKPVKLTWMREDDVHNDKPRPLVAQHLEVGLDQQGRITSWRHRLAGETIYGRANPAAFKGAGGRDAPFHEGAESLYDFPNLLIEYLRQERGVDVGFWRGVGGGYTKFALETVLDEIAANRKLDPLVLRLELLAKHPRAMAALREVAAMAGWHQPRSPGRGLGIAYSELWETHTATIAEVSVDRSSSELKVHRLWTAVDAGVLLMPDSVLAQVEGGMLWGLEAATKAELTFKGGAVQQSNFNDYPVVRLADLPQIEVRLLRNENAPGGVGECGVPTVAPAIANAVAELTGKRLRTLPFSSERVRAALSEVARA